jgi:hypothetical protein
MRGGHGFLLRDEPDPARAVLTSMSELEEVYHRAAKRVKSPV